MGYDNNMYQEFIEILILSAVQGISEFLPISSAAHLILVSNMHEFKKKYFDYVKENVDLISTYELLSPLLALCFGVPGSKKFKQEVNDLIRSRDIQKLEYAYLNLIAA